MYYKNRFMFIVKFTIKKKLYFPYCTLFCSSQKSGTANGIQIIYKYNYTA